MKGGDRWLRGENTDSLKENCCSKHGVKSYSEMLELREPLGLKKIGLGEGI